MRLQVRVSRPMRLFIYLSFLFLLGLLTLLYLGVEEGPREIPGEIRREIRRASKFRPYFLYDFRRVLAPSKQQCKPEGQFFVILVHSAPAYGARRALVRESWGHHTSLRQADATLVFVMGSVPDRDVMAAIRQESQEHGDILQEDYLDSYNNLTYKAVSWLRWLQRNCGAARFILKTDDDVLTNVGQLAHLLRTWKDGGLIGGWGWEAPKFFMACNYWKSAGVERRIWQKWYVSPEEYRLSTYGNICQGAAYVLSVPLARELYRLHLSTPFFRLDDVYVTGFLPQQLPGVKVAALNQHYMTEKEMTNDTLEVLLAEPLFVHHVKPADHFAVWDHLQKLSYCRLHARH